jgi:hypothetical protein
MHASARLLTRLPPSWGVSQAQAIGVRLLQGLRLTRLASRLGLTSLIQTLALTLPSRIRPTRATTTAAFTDRKLPLKELGLSPEVLWLVDFSVVLVL